MYAKRNSQIKGFVMPSVFPSFQHFSYKSTLPLKGSRENIFPSLNSEKISNTVMDWADARGWAPFAR